MQSGGKMDTTEIIFGLAIAVTYTSFFNKLAEYAFRSNDGGYNDDAKFKEHVALIVFAIIGIILSGFVSGTSPKFGLGIGGFVTLFIAISMYWSHYKELPKLLILGSTLSLLLYMSVRLYSIKSITDVIMPEFGTK